jgi:hypothetical protein
VDVVEVRSKFGAKGQASQPEGDNNKALGGVELMHCDENGN